MKPSTPRHVHFSFNLLCGQVLCKPAQTHCSPATPTRALLGLASQGDCIGPEPVPPRQCPPYNYSEGRPAVGAALTPGSWPLTQNLGPAQVWSSRQRGRKMLRGMGGKGRQRAAVALRHQHLSASSTESPNHISTAGWPQVSRVTGVSLLLRHD